MVLGCLSSRMCILQTRTYLIFSTLQLMDYNIFQTRRDIKFKLGRDMPIDDVGPQPKLYGTIYDGVYFTEKKWTLQKCLKMGLL